jgi:N-acetylneuraminate synthase
MVKPIQIGGRSVGPGLPCFVIAEAGVNHNGDPSLARRLVEAAAKAGADAVKFQTFRADTLASPSAPKAAYQKVSGGPDESQQEMLRRLELSPAIHLELVAVCRQRNLLFLSSPFDEESADFLARLPVPALKIPSGELTNLPFLAHVARLGVPLIVSTGMADLSEVAVAVETIRRAGSPPLALLHCVSNYPAAPATCNLRAMATLQTAFGFPVGFSDHTLGLSIGLAAVALGACVIEKHFTMDKNLPGPDHPASLVPAELREFIQGIRAVEAALGDGRKVPALSERETALIVRKSVVALVDLPAGARIEASMLGIRRPGGGLLPAELVHVVGRTTRMAVLAGQPLTWGMIQ